jgi:hypothetical protein
MVGSLKDGSTVRITSPPKGSIDSQSTWNAHSQRVVFTRWRPNPDPPPPIGGLYFFGDVYSCRIDGSDLRQHTSEDYASLLLEPQSSQEQNVFYVAEKLEPSKPQLIRFNLDNEQAVPVANMGKITGATTFGKDGLLWQSFRQGNYYVSMTTSRANRVDLRRSGTYRVRSMDTLCWGRPSRYQDLVDENAWKGANGLLWSKLSEAQSIARQLEGIVIAVSLCTDLDAQQLREKAVPGYAYLYLDDAGPPSIERSWVLLGYDVVDSGFKSIVCPVYFGQLVASDVTNSFGLLVEYETAEYWRRAADMEISEHSPFLTLAIHATDSMSSVWFDIGSKVTPDASP